MRLSIEGARRGGYPVLGPITLEIAAGEVVALLGPSGIGKTTLLRLVAGLDPAPRGAVTGTGRLGMVFQEPTLLPWRSALANVALAAECDAASARTMLARVGLGGREDAFPRALSLGQQRRVALARAFAAEPETLLMDEPFVSLDPAASEEMQTLLSGLLADRPARVLMVTHSGDEALRLADRIVHLGGSPARILGERRIATPRPARDAAWRAEAAGAAPGGGSPDQASSQRPET